MPCSILVPQITNRREDRHVFRIDLRKRTVTPRTPSQEMGSFVRQQMSPTTVWRCLQQLGMSAPWPWLWLLLTLITDISVSNGVIIDKNLDAGMTSRHLFRRIQVLYTASWCPHRGECVLQACIRLRHTGPGVMVWGAIGYTSPSPLVRITDNLNNNRYISEVLQSLVLLYV